MKRYVYPSEIKGSIKAPASKSAMQRSIAAALLADGESMLVNPTFCDDSIAAMRVAEGLGAGIKKVSDHVLISGGLKPVTDTLHCGESGLCIRMFTPVAALTGTELTLTGEKSLAERPVSAIEGPLRELGAEISSENGRLPLKVSGKLSGGATEIDGSMSSQFLTGLLMALPSCTKDSLLSVNNLKSREYIDLTINILKQFSVEIENHGYREFKIKGNQKFRPGIIEIEGDWSGAAFLLCAGAIAGDITVNGISTGSSQPDRAVVDALKSAGADISVKKDSIEIRKSSLKGFEFDATECPDLFPPLAALALYCSGETVIHGAERLKHKESDRGNTIKTELEKIGGEIELLPDRMIIRGAPVTGGEVESHGDHRIAMACAIAALGASSHVAINGAECVSKSYSEFFDHIIKLGVSVK
ncbi:MAG TPA: 3-phosphoshikimate 1-carboxyvinyltransferase [Spirochaetota bacterium]|nr:3-phosphoshikimate 1-carboxyvinyltransferase [Spirochaetota bacterium]